MAYTVQISRNARRDIRGLPHNIAARIDPHILELAKDPRPPGCQRLVGQSAYRIRVGDYRIVYEIHDDVLIVLIVRVGHRREIYKGT